MSDHHPTSKTGTTEMVHADRKEGLLKTTSVLAYLLFLVLNLHTVGIFQQPQIYEEIQQTYFTPDNWVFLVWPIIHVLLLCPILYSHTSGRGNAVVINRISWEFPLFMVLYAFFVTLRTNNHPVAAFGLSFCLVYVAFSINFLSLLEEYSPESVGEQLFIVFPFSVCQAWNTFIFCLSAFEAFGVDAIKQDAGTWTGFWVVVAL